MENFSSEDTAIIQQWVEEQVQAALAVEYPDPETLPFNLNDIDTLLAHQTVISEAPLKNLGTPSESSIQSGSGGVPAGLDVKNALKCEWMGCAATFELTPEGFTKHWRASQHSNTSRRCHWGSCDRNLKSASMKAHVLDVHLPFRWICGECSRWDFRTERARVKHQASCRGKPPQMNVVACGECRAIFGSETEMTHHADAGCPAVDAAQ